MRRNKKGFTLVEFIVALVLMSMLLAMGFSIYRFGTATYAREVAGTLSQSDLRAAISVITKDIRKHPDGISASSNSITVGPNTYTLSDNTLLANSGQLITGIESFNVSKTGNKITIEIISEENTLGDSMSYKRTIAVR